MVVFGELVGVVLDGRDGRKGLVAASHWKKQSSPAEGFGRAWKPTCIHGLMPRSGGSGVASFFEAEGGSREASNVSYMEIRYVVELC